ncbi:hypothetical protein CVT24_000947 [Panaeolus cyanescens]|uniref:Uncharacterized protein n=1 Tax=Panaeolus cyanescens TaxID=181874 RepID=A0A409YCK0_9AGAR|nr:hypothetical protein CVT24_000947 [Panaeolus cyanescens]
MFNIQAYASQVYQERKQAVRHWGKSREKAIQALVKRDHTRSPSLPPSVVHLLRSNDPPNEDEALVIHDALEKAKTQLAARIYSSSPSTPSAEVEQLQGQILQLEAVSSAIRRFPTEILQTIFAFGLFPRPMQSMMHRAPDSPFQWPWTVAHVCRTWRSAALSTPVLWSYLPPSPLSIQRRSFSNHWRRRQDMFEFMINHSQNLGLHIIVKGDPKPNTTHPCPIIHLLVSLAERWETASLDLATDQLDLFSNIRNRLPRLRELTIVVSSLSDNCQSFDLFAVAPQLKVVSYENQTDFRHLVMRFPPSQLVSYSLVGCWSNEQVREMILSNASTLQTLHLGDNAVFESKLNLPPVTLPNLKTLSIGNSQHACNGLDNIIVPALEEFSFSTHHSSVMCNFLELLRRSSKVVNGPHLLKTLRIGRKSGNSIGTYPEQFIDMLELASCLQSLECPLPRRSDILYRLAETDPSHALLPSLQDCTFFLWDHISTESAQALNCLARSRCEIPSEELIGSLALPYPRRLKNLRICKYPESPAAQTHKLDHWLTSCQQLLNLGQSLDTPEDLNPRQRPLHFFLEGPQALIINRLQELVHDAISTPIISKRKASALTSHLLQCEEMKFSVDQIMTPQLQSLEFGSLKRNLRAMKKTYPYLQELGRALDSLLHSWVTTINENMLSLHWFYDRSSVTQRLFYLPLSDSVRYTNSFACLVLRLDDENRDQHQKAIMQPIEGLL